MSGIPILLIRGQLTDRVSGIPILLIRGATYIGCVSCIPILLIWGATLRQRVWHFDSSDSGAIY